MPLPTEKLVITFDPEAVAALTALHERAAQSYPTPPDADLLTEIDAAEYAVHVDANEQIRAFAASLRQADKRPWFEVWYPNTTDADFDAVEVGEDGTITTLPPYSELEA